MIRSSFLISAAAAAVLVHTATAQTRTTDPDHARLAAMAGTWDIEMTLWPRPGGPGLSTKGTSTIRVMLDGLFIEERIEGALGGAPFTTMAWTGYNTSTHQYEATRISTTNTARIAEAGTYDEKNNQFELKADYALGADTWHQRTVIRQSSADAMIASSYLSFGTVPEWKGAEIKYTRRAGAPSPAGGAGGGTFVVLSGADTISIEHFTRADRELTGSIETRVNGRTSRATYSVLRDAARKPARFESSLTVPQRGIGYAALDLAGDSIRGPVMVFDKESYFRGALPRGTLPLLTLVSTTQPFAASAPPVSIAMLDDVIRNAAASGDVSVLEYGNATPGARTLAVTRVDPKTADVGLFGGIRVTLDANGHIASATSAGAPPLAIHFVPETGSRVALRPAAGNASREGPPMGWNSWNHFGCNISESLLRETADAMVRTGMLAAGYRYLNIDDCWEAPARDAQGNLAVDSARFPSGMKALVAYIHSKGLKAGIYSSGGTATCQKRPATLDHEAADARLFAGWEIDYVKYDNCNAQGRPEQQRFKIMIDAVRSSGRNMLFSVCEWGEARPWLWASQMGGTLWRTTEDIRDSWMSVLGILDQQVGLDLFSGPGAWNDPDMLEVGNGKMTHDQYVAHFSLWALLNAPLIAGNDVRVMNDSTRAILLNKDVIAVDQDFFVHQGFRLRNDGAQQVWAKPMSDGGWALVLLNRGLAPAAIQVTKQELDDAMLAIAPPGAASRSVATRAATVQDLWTNETAPATDAIRRTVPATGAVMLRIRGH